jgi:REP-associated tyrosine transposase
VDVKQNGHRPKRRSIRLPGYNYSGAGAYFVSICTKDRECLFGDIVNQEMVLNDAGQTVATIWNELPNRFYNIELVEYVIMPNHIHGIITIVGAPLVGARWVPEQPRSIRQYRQAQDNGQAQDLPLRDWGIS